MADKNVQKQDITFGNQASMDALDFGKAFQFARLKAGGAGGVFNWKGKKYTTDFKNETWSPTYPGKRTTSKVASNSTPPSDKGAPPPAISTSASDNADYEPEDVNVDEKDLYNFPGKGGSLPSSGNKEIDPLKLFLGAGALAYGAGRVLGRVFKLPTAPQTSTFPPRAPRISYEDLYANKNTIPVTGPSRFPLTTTVPRQTDLVSVSGPINVHEDTTPSSSMTIGSHFNPSNRFTLDVSPEPFERHSMSPDEIGYTKPAGLLTGRASEAPGPLLLGPGKLPPKRKPRTRRPPKVE